MEILNNKFVKFDFTGENLNIYEATKKVAAKLKTDPGWLFSQISLAAVGAVQTKNLVGHQAIIVTYVVASQTNATRELGLLVISNVTVVTPSNRQYTQQCMQVYNRIFTTPQLAQGAYLGLLDNMKAERYHGR